jgi:hypothetical protein
MLETLKNYCLNTNLNGFIYIAQPSRHKIERIFWSLLILASFILTGILINKLLQETQNNPIVIYTDQNVVHVENVNFPAVSVCPGVILNTPRRTIMNYEATKRFILNLEVNLTQDEADILRPTQLASLIARDNFAQNHLDMITIPTDDFIEQMNRFEPFFFTAHDIIRNRTFSFFDATWLQTFIASFTQTLWKVGFCYTFNFPDIQDMFHLQNISKDFRYKTLTPGTDSYELPPLNAKTPLKSPLPGNGLTVRYNKEHLNMVKNPEQTNSLMHQYKYIQFFNILDGAIPQTLKSGHRFIFHDGYEVIPFNAKSFFSNSDSVTKILITPNVKRVDESLIHELPEM